MMFPLMIIIGVRIVKTTLKHVKMLRKPHLNILSVTIGSKPSKNENVKKCSSSRTSESKKQSEITREKHATIATEILKVVGTVMLNRLQSETIFVASSAKPLNLKDPRCPLRKKSTKNYSTQTASKLGEKNSKLPLMKRPAITIGNTQPLLKTQTWIFKILASNPSKPLAKRRNNAILKNSL